MLTTTAIAIWLVRSLVFLFVAIPACTFAVRRGGGPERLTAVLVCIAIIASTLVPLHSWRQVVEPLMLIDGLMLVGMFMIALLADRYWPLYFAAVQLLTVAVHGVRVYDASILPAVYARLVGELAYLTLVILIIGTWRHMKRGTETDWSWQVKDEGGTPDART